MILENLDLPEDLIAVHWFKDKGWEEHKNGDQVMIKDIGNINQYRHVLDAYNEMYSQIPEDRLPMRNSDLIDFVEDMLMNIDLMRQSDEWEDFKIATNRA